MNSLYCLHEMFVEVVLVCVLVVLLRHVGVKVFPRWGEFKGAVFVVDAEVVVCERLCDGVGWVLWNPKVNPQPFN